MSYILGPEGDPSGASLLAGPPAIPDGAGLRLVLSLLLLVLSVRFCPDKQINKHYDMCNLWEMLPPFTDCPRTSCLFFVFFSTPLFAFLSYIVHDGQNVYK